MFTKSNEINAAKAWGVSVSNKILCPNSIAFPIALTYILPT